MSLTSAQSWALLLVSAVLEAVWATALGASDGLSNPVPTVVFVLALISSTVGLGFAMKKIPTATAYAVWTGLGASLTVAWAMIQGTEPVSVLRVALLLTLIGCIAGLKISETGKAQPNRYEL